MRCAVTSPTAIPVTVHCVATAATSVTDWIIAIATVLAALGTVAAVSVALWQTKRQSRANLRVESKYIIKNGISGHRSAQHVVRLEGTNYGPATIRLVEASLMFRAASGTLIGNMIAGGDTLPKVLEVGESVWVEWDHDTIEQARKESDGQPFTHMSLIDAFGREHPAPYPGMRQKRRWLLGRPREYEPIRD